jgi:hypothetical protein
MVSTLTNNGYEIIIDHDQETIEFIKSPSNRFGQVFGDGNKFNLILKGQDELNFVEAPFYLKKFTEGKDAFFLRFVVDGNPEGIPVVILKPNPDNFENYQDVYIDNKFIAYFDKDGVMEMIFIHNRNFYLIHYFEEVDCFYRPLSDIEFSEYSENLLGICDLFLVDSNMKCL